MDHRLPPETTSPAAREHRLLKGHFLWGFLAVLVVLGGWLSYATLTQTSDGTPSGAGARAAASGNAPARRARGGRQDPEQLDPSVQVAGPTSADPDSPARLPAGAGSARAVPPPPNPSGPRVWHGPRLSHPRDGQGYSRRAVEAWRDAGGTGPSPEAIRVWGPSLLDEDPPMQRGSTGTPIALPAESDRVQAAPETAEADGELPGHRLWTHDQPYVESYDQRGSVHRLYLDHNQHLYYRSPTGQELPIDVRHRVTTFNLRLDLADQVHVAWFERDARQLNYAWLVPVGVGDLAIHYRDFLAKPEEPDFIEIIPMPDHVKVIFGTGDQREYIRIGVADPAVRARGR